MKSRNRRMQILHKRDLPWKARAVIRMRLLHCGFPTEQFVATNRTENKSPRSPILPVCISARPNMTIDHRLICRNVGSTKNRISIWRPDTILFLTQTLSAATAAALWSTRQTNSSALSSTATFNHWWPIALTPTRRRVLSPLIPPRLSRRFEKFTTRSHS